MSDLGDRIGASRLRAGQSDDLSSAGWNANEVVEAYRYIMQLRHEPAVLALSRQPLPTLDRSKYAPASRVAHGAYVLGDASDGKPEVILVASGSEVSLCVNANGPVPTGSRAASPP
jgi:transketolase